MKTSEIENSNFWEKDLLKDKGEIQEEKNRLQKECWE